MIILQQSGTAQEFNIIPRVNQADSMIITNETTGVSTTYAITASLVGYYLNFSKIVTLEQGVFYTIKVLNGLDVIYRDKIFCTNQAVTTYSVNDSEFTTNSTNNDYITV